MITDQDIIVDEDVISDNDIITDDDIVVAKDADVPSGTPPIQPTVSATSQPVTLTDDDILREVDSDLTSQVLMGVKESLLPFAIDKEEYIEAEPTGVDEVAARIAANIITDIASSATVGAIAGSIALPIVGTAAGATIGTVAGIGMGIYRALGFESMMAEVQDRDFDVANAAVNIAVEVNPLFKIAGKGAKQIAKQTTRVAAQGGVQYTQAKQYGATDTVAKIAGVVGAGVTGAAGFLGPLVSSKKLSNKGMKASIEAMEEDGRSLEITQKALAKMEAAGEAEAFYAKNASMTKATKPEHFDELYDINPEAMNSMITPKEEKAVAAMMTAMSNKTHPATGKPITLDISEEVVKRESARMRFAADMENTARVYVPKSKKEGVELIEEGVKAARASGLSEKQAWALTRQAKYIDDVIQEEVEVYGKNIGLREPITNNLFEEGGDLLYIAKATEHVSGISMTRMVDDMAKAHNTHSYFMQGAIKEVKDVLKLADTAKLPRNKIGTMLEAGIENAPASYRPTLKRASEVFERIKSDVMAKGVAIDTIDNYFTRVTVPQDLAMARVRNAMSQYSNSEIVKGTTGVPNDLRRILSASVDEPLTESNLKKALQAFEREGFDKSKEGFASMASFSRHGSMPELIRERDFARVVMTYANNLHKAAVIDPVIKQLRMTVPALEALGFKRSAKYWNKYIADMSGKASEAKSIKLQQQMQTRSLLIEKLEFGDITGLEKLGGQTKLYARDLLSYGMSQFYPNFLGWRLAAPARNMTQPFLMTATEIGGKGKVGQLMSSYGVKLATNAWADLLKNPGKFKTMRKELVDQGYFAGKFIGEGVQEYERSLRKSVKGLGIPLAMIDKINEVGMWMYTMSDMVNRYITRNMSAQLTKDILAGNEASKFFVKRLPEGLRAEVAKTMRDKDFGKTQQLVTDYVMGKTQLNYGRHALSQFGREHGHLVSMFTKWPTSVASDTYVGFKHEGKGLSRLTQRLLAPLAGLVALQQIREEADLPPQVEVFLKKDLTDMSPIMAMKIGTPPVLESLYRTGRAAKSYAEAGWSALEGDMETAELRMVHGTEQLGEGIGSVLPLGYGLIKGGQPTVRGLLGEEDE